MKDTPTIDILQNLKGVLHKIMNKGVTCSKYTNALEVAIANLELDSIAIETDYYRIDVDANDSGIIINVATSTGELLETYEFFNGGVIDESTVGES